MKGEAQDRVRERHKKLPCRQVRVPDEVLRILHHAGRNARLLEKGNDLLRSSPGSPSPYQFVKLLSVRPSCGRTLKAAVAG